MGFDSGLGELSGMMSGLSYDDIYSESNTMGGGLGFRLDELQPLNLPPMVVVGGGAGGGNENGSLPSTLSKGGGAAIPEDCEINSDIAINYISRIMEEDIDEKVSFYQEEATLRAAAMPFYDILGQTFPPSPDRPPLSGHYSLESPSESINQSWSSGIAASQTSISCPSSGIGDTIESFEEPLITAGPVPEFLIESFPAWHFCRGVEVAERFLPSQDKLVINAPLPQERRKAEEGGGSRVRKSAQTEDLDVIEGRSNKQSAVSSDEPLHAEMFDKILLNPGEEKANGLREMMRTGGSSKNSQNGQTKGPNGGRSRGRKQSKKEVVDLRTLLVHCAQAVAADDRRTASELLKQLRQHSSLNGDGTQRMAFCFADGLEARLAGNGSQIYHTLVSKRTTATDMLKAYHFYLAACPFKKVSHFFSNQTILNAAEKASRVHIIDFGIFFGFQWPCLIQRFSNREGGPPRLRITGIDVPQPGFRPSERIEETGRRLAEYANKFDVPFEYKGIASKWETIRVEDLNVNEGEVVIVNCLYRFRNLIDETVAVDSPRNRVLDTIRRLNPDVFIHGIVNGSYSVPFFITRFREALFHFSALFDMLETTVPRDDEQRLLIERDLFGREALNVIACEGSERVERPETYKQWQVRNLRAGFLQLPLNPDIMKKAKEKVRATYHKDFVIDEDSQWLLQGWKGRIIYAISNWKPTQI